jgi:multimeric flavodoxin WrbA
MKVIGLNGSPRKNWNSAQMLEHALKGAAAAGAETELIHLIDLNATGCRSCFACKRIGGKSFGRCAVRDDLTDILNRILEADAVIISAPVYFGDVPGMVRNLFERLWFPGLMYRRDGACAYDKKVKVGLIYTMNCPDEHFYDSLIAGHKGTFERFFGETKVVCATETLQFDNYDLYVGDMFDVPRRQEKHEKVFPEDCRRAFQMGEELVK